MGGVLYTVRHEFSGELEDKAASALSAGEVDRLPTGRYTAAHRRPHPPTHCTLQAGAAHDFLLDVLDQETEDAIFLLTFLVHTASC